MSISYEMSPNCEQRFAYISYYFPPNNIKSLQDCCLFQILHQLTSSSVCSNSPQPQTASYCSRQRDVISYMYIYCMLLTKQIKMRTLLLLWQRCQPLLLFTVTSVLRSLGRLSKVLTCKMLKILYQNCKKSSWLRVDAKVYLRLVQQPNISAYNHVLKFSFITTQAVTCLKRPLIFAN